MSALDAIRNKLSGFRENLAFSNRWSIIAQRLFHPGRPVVSYFWKRRWWIVCDTRCHDANAVKEVLAGGCYDSFITRSARDGCLSYVNIGAHIGTFDVAVASLVGKIPFGCSVEMNPGTFARLNFNLRLNGLVQVRTINAGVGGENGNASVRATGCSLADNLFAKSAAQTEGGESFIVPVLTLAKVLKQVGAAEREFDLLKVDCEGAEYSIIEESSPALLRRFANVVMELHPPAAGCSVDRLYRKMESSGFTTTEAQPREMTCGELRFWTRTEP